MSDISSRLAHLKLFKHHVDEDDKGEAISHDAIGHHHRTIDPSKSGLRVSHALRSFIVDNGILPERDAGLKSDTPTDALRGLLVKSHVEVPRALLDPTHPFPEYFVSSSHNTYLVAHQLYGGSSAEAYETAIKTGSRCVEIDAWDNADNESEPKVTHGYTLVSHIPFRAVCETIRAVFDEEAALAASQPWSPVSPILISLENHCGPRGQLRLAQIMREVFGDRLLSRPVREKGTREQDNSGEHVTLAELGSKIVLIVEFHLGSEDPEEPEEYLYSDEDDETDEQRRDRLTYQENKKAAASVVIIPELAELGVYAQSVKPKDNSWYDPGILANGPHHHLINVSETGLAAHLPAKSGAIARHNAKHLMRVFPKGTRISSSNLKPVPFWGIGAQICALNWQTYAASNQLNTALFSGSEGFVLKPAALRQGGNGDLRTGRRRRLFLHVAGASDVPIPDERGDDEIKPYLTCQLYSALDHEAEPPKRKTSHYRHHRLGFLHRGENPEDTDPIWDEELEWDYEDNELVFLRMLIKSDDRFARNPKFAVAAVRLLYVVPGWSFIRMLDLKGRETDCTVLVKFEFEDAGPA